MIYTVLKQHYGDQQYFQGDEREVENKADAKALLEAGLIGEAKAEKVEAKAAPKHKNKMARTMSNKSE